DLANLIITSASINAGDTLIANISGGGTQSYALIGSFGGDTLKVAPDGGSGSDVILYRLAAGSITPNPLAIGDVHTNASITRHLGVKNTQPNDHYSETLDGSITSFSGNISAGGSFTA